MTPVLIRETHPHNSTWRMPFSLTEEATGDPLTNGTVAYVMKTASGQTVAGSSVNGTHVANGVWVVVVPALGLTVDAAYHATLTVTAAGGSSQFDWWLRAVEVAPDFSGG